MQKDVGIVRAKSVSRQRRVGLKLMWKLCYLKEADRARLCEI